MADQATSTDLIISLPAVPNVATFTDEQEFDKLYSAILQKVEEHKPDVSTRKGRDEIASLAYKVARTKTTLDKQGKDLTEEWRTNTTKVNATRNIIKGRLEKLQATVRKPLDDWEDVERDRIDRLQASLDMLLSFMSMPAGRASIDLKQYRDTVESTVVDATWEEFEDRGHIAKTDALAALDRLIAVAEKQEADAKELEELRAAKAERDRIDAERRATEEAAQAAAERVERERLAEQERKDAISKAAADAAERAGQEAAAKVAAAEREASEAKARAERQIAEALAQSKREAEQQEAWRRQKEQEIAERAESERKRLADEQEAEASAQRRRDADRDHRKTVDNAIAAELVACAGISDAKAKQIVIHLASGLVPHCTLKY